MCGIAGVVLRDPAADVMAEQPRLDAALARMRHRGPDDCGVYSGRGVALGNRRLAILDLTPAGHQPMLSASRDVAMVLNGEIYNYLELRRTLEARGRAFRGGSDTEVLLAAWEEWGLGVFEHLRGMFAFAVWNAAAGRLVLARDRVGEKPLFYWSDETRFVFASELKALLELMPTRPRLSPAAVDTYLHYQFVVEPETPLEGVRKLPAAHWLEVGTDAWRTAPARYWEPERVGAIDGSPADHLRASLDSAVELTLRSDVPVGIALSGGLDSAVVAALASRRSANLSALTVGYPGRPAFDERAVAQELAGRLGMPFISAELATDQFASFFPDLVAAIDEPIADVAAYGHYAVARLAREHGIKVLLTGIGGDELFFGYGWVREAVRLSRLKQRIAGRGSALDKIRASLLQRVLDRPRLHAIAANHRFPDWWRRTVDRSLDYGRLDLAHAGEWVFYQLDYHWAPATRFTRDVLSDAARSAIADRQAFALMEGFDVEADAQLAIWRLLCESWLASNCLALGDRVSMAVSVETRIPLLERSVVETVLGLWKGGRTDDSAGHKTWLRAAVADLLPPEVLNRPKQGFVTPTREWIAAVNERYRGKLLDGVLVAEGVVDHDRLAAWMDRTRGLHRDFFEYKLTLLELWARGVLHQQPLGAATDDLQHT